MFSQPDEPAAHSANHEDERKYLLGLTGVQHLCVGLGDKGGLSFLILFLGLPGVFCEKLSRNH